MTLLPRINPRRWTLLALAPLAAGLAWSPPPAGAAIGEAAAPGMAPPRSPEQILKLLQGRGRQQREISQVFQAFHGFQFTNRIRESGIDFKPRVVDDVGRHNKPVHYDHGVGMAIADVDGDGRIDVYFAGQLGGSQLWRNVGGGKFENATEAAGVGLAGRISVGAAFADIDNDGDPDLFVTGVRTGNVLFENTGGGKFKDITTPAGLGYSGHSSGAVFFDYNRDGRLDLLVCNVGKYTTDNRGRGGYYIGITNAFSGHLNPALSEPSLLYQNLGGAKFQLVGGDVFKHAAWTGDASAGDVNGDGFPDLYLLNMQGDDHFFLNQGGRGFVERTAAYFPKTPWGSMGIKFFDFNNDGAMDLYVTDMHSDMTSQQTVLQRGLSRAMEKAKSEAFCTFEWDEAYLQDSSNNLFGNALWLGRAEGPFPEVSDEAGAETYWPWGVSVGDLNADGFQDVFAASGMGYPYGYGLNELLLNEHGRRFFNAEFLLGIEPRLDNQLATEYFTLDCGGEDKDHPECRGQTGRISVYGVVSTRSSAIFDLDDDGDLDLVTNELLEKPQVFVSNLAGKTSVHFLKIKLTGTRSNRDGVGARVQVTAGGKTYAQPHDGKSGYLGQSCSVPLYFGLGQAERASQVEVLWPSGQRQVVKDGLAPNATVSIVEPP